MRVCNCSMFCCTLLYVHSSIAIILMGKRELVALLNLSSWCLVMVGRLFLAVPRGCLRFVIVVFPDHTHLLFQITNMILESMVTVKHTNKLTDISLHELFSHIYLPVLIFGTMIAYGVKMKTTICPWSQWSRSHILKT